MMSEQNIAFNVEGMSCENCARSIKNALMQLNGVYNVIVDIETKRVAIEYDDERLNADILKGTSEDLGYIVK